MCRTFGWVALLVAGVLLALASGSNQRISAEPNDDSARAASNASEITAQLKEINSQLKSINEHLHTGVTKVMIPMNPEKRD